MTLIEVILGLSILAMVTIGLNQLSDRWADDTKNTVAASQVRTFGEAVQSYIKDNYAAVQGVATATTPAIIDVPTLIAAQKLTAGYQNSNAFGQATCALVLQPTANRLQAMVITEGGNTVGDPQLSTVAATVGGSGGGVYSTDTANIKGAVGGWVISTSTYDNLANNLGKTCSGAAGNVRVTAGHPMMALWFENGDVSSAFVARDAVPGRPELNAMSTPLVMNSVQTGYNACSSNGAIAQDGQGRILSCQNNKWQPIGDGKCTPLNSTTDLNTLQDGGRCFDGYGMPNSPGGSDWVFVEVFRHWDNSVYYLTQRVIGMTGPSIGKTWTRSQNSSSPSGGWTGWYQISDPNVNTYNGNVSAAGAVQANSVTGNSAVTSAGYMYSAGYIQSSAGLYGTYVYSSGDIDTDGNLYSHGSAVNYNGATYNVTDNTWSFLGYGAGFNANAQPTNPIGSAYLNDVYLRSVGRWVSQMLTPQSYSIGWNPYVAVGAVQTFAPNWYVSGTPISVSGEVTAYGGNSCNGTINARWRDGAGNVIRDWTAVAASNSYNGNDGGSGMWNTFPFNLPMLNGAYYIDFEGAGCWGSYVNVFGVTMQ